MNRRQILSNTIALVSLILAPIVASAQGNSSTRKPDLADAAEGTYFGDVISDSKGPSKSDVTLTVARIGPNRIRVTSDYPRLPIVEVALSSAMGRILNQGGDTNFLLDRNNGVTKLDVSFLSEVSWSGAKR